MITIEEMGGISLDFCWKWIEKREVNEEKIYEFLDDEDDLVGYMLYAKDEIEKKELAVILGVVSYIYSCFEDE